MQRREIDKTQMWLFHVFFWQRAARNLAARAAHLYFPIRPIKFLIDIDVVTITVIDANGLY